MVFFISCKIKTKMTLHYVYVDSRNRNRSEPINDFKVHLHQPIKNVSRAGLVSFSKGNNSWNVHAENNTIKWREIFFNTNNNTYAQLAPHFEIQITPGYYGINELLTQITTKMSSKTGRLVSSETPTTYTYSIDDDYRVSIMATASTSTASNRYWAFYHPDDKLFNSSILHAMLNLQREDVASTNVITDAVNEPVAHYFRQTKSSLSVDARTLKSRFSYTENQAVIYLASNELTENSQRMVNYNGVPSTMKTNILETISVSVNRWSYVHLNKVGSDIQYHSMHNKTISNFDLKMLGEHYELLHEDAESDFKAVIVFESIDQPNEEINRMHMLYNDSAYRQAHRIQ